jgi:hypothetical protein
VVGEGDPQRYAAAALRAAEDIAGGRSNLSRRVRAFMRWIEGVLAPYLE